MTSLDERIRSAYGPSTTDDEVRERLWIRSLKPTPTRRSNRRRWRTPRTLFAVALLVVSVGSIAIAQPGPLDRIMGGERQADRLSVLQEPDPIGTEGLSEMTTHGFFDPSIETGLGSVVPAQLHHVLDYEGNGYTVRLRSGESADGQACLYQELLTNNGTSPIMGGGSCSRAMYYNGHITVGYGGNSKIGTVIAGLATDDVDQVRVKLSTGEIRDAQMGRNGFLLHLPNPEVRPRGLVVDLKDGRSIDVAMNGCLPAQLANGHSRLGCGYGLNKLPPTPVR
ncbi:MAG: hypothetical protein KDC46_08675 [Thermoleophilia bacterium]|nr:hypothetical protein [Thermoleophilia bacterium]